MSTLRFQRARCTGFPSPFRRKWLKHDSLLVARYRTKRPDTARDNGTAIDRPCLLFDQSLVIDQALAFKRSLRCYYERTMILEIIIKKTMRARATIHYMNFKSVYIFTYICFAEYSQGCRLGFLLFFSHFPRPLFYFFFSFLYIRSFLYNFYYRQCFFSLLFLFYRLASTPATFTIYIYLKHQLVSKGA